MSIPAKILLGLAATVLLSLFLSEGAGIGQRCAVRGSVAGAAGPSAEQRAQAQACQRDVDAAAQRGTIAFASGGSVLAASANPVLDALAGALKACAEVRVEVGGHTDLRGAPEINQALSQRRADAVVAALAGRGVPPARLTARGFGETRPVVAAVGRDADARNRRTTFTITPAPSTPAAAVSSAAR